MAGSAPDRLSQAGPGLDRIELVWLQRKEYGSGRSHPARAATFTMRLSEPDRERAVRAVARLLVSRLTGELTENEVAREVAPGLGLEKGPGGVSAPEMHARLRALGLPEWIVYPEGHEDVDEGEPAPKAKKKREAKTFGEARELPKAVRAERLFRRDIERLYGYVELLPQLEERLAKGPQRWLSYLVTEDDWEAFDKEDYTEAQWRRLCEKQGEDPTTDSFVVDFAPSASPFGVGTAPWEGLVRLVAVHALVDGSVDSLLELLHPDPGGVDREEFEKKLNDEKRGYLTDLKNSAERLAKLVRGGEVRRGVPPPGLSRAETWVAWDLISPLAARDLSNERVVEELDKDGSLEVANAALGYELTAAEVGRLRGLGGPPR